jgi:hypothetical protein
MSESLKVLNVYLLLAAAIALAACGNGLPVDGFIPVESEIVPMSLLYLEEAKFPETIYENEPFDVEFRFSAATTPELLGSGMIDRCYSFIMPRISNPPKDAAGAFGLAFWFVSKTQVEEPGDSFIRQFEGLPVGTWIYDIYSTETPEQAGLLQQIDLLNGGGCYKYPGSTLREYRIEVVPRP